MGKGWRRLGNLMALVALALLTGRSAAGQAAKETPGIAVGSTDLTLFAGVAASASHEDKAFGLEAKTATPIGGRLAYNFSAHHAAEFSIANPLSVSGNYVYHFSPIFGHWVPYLTAGVGGARRELGLGDGTQSANANINLDESGQDRNQTAFTGNFGGGVLYLIGRRLAARFDVRDQVGHYQATFTGVPGVPTGIVRADQTIHDIQITAGIVLRFNRK